MEKISNTIELKNLLSKTRFTVNYYQREYRWGTKQIDQLLEDLTSAFLLNYNDSKYEHCDTKEVKNYGYYYMGSIIRTNDQNNKEIIDGQQRLTSLTLMLIYINNILKKDYPQIVGAVSDMIYSDSCGEMSFNIDVPERKDCFKKLYNNCIDFVPNDESSKNMLDKYKYICEIFPQELLGEVLPFFTYWLIEKVLFMEIIAPSEQDAHKVFVTMNDRGLSLNSAEMLKGYLLSEIKDDDDRSLANKIWKDTIKLIKESSQDNNEGIVNAEDVDFISTWIRGKYANSMRDTKKGAKDEDYEIIGSEFHQWVRSNAKKMGLDNSLSYKNLICEEMKLFSSIYLKLKEYSKNLTPGFEEVYFNANRELNYQIMMMISAIDLNDNIDTQNIKIKLVSTFIDIFASIRIFNFKKINFNSNKSILFRIMKKIRNKKSKEIAKILTLELSNMEISLVNIRNFQLNQFTGRYMLHVLARLTSYINSQMNNPSHFAEYVDRSSKNSYDIEHIIPNVFDEYAMLFDNENDFDYWRSKIGNLIILTKDRNRSYQAMNCSKKLELYFGDNVLAQSLSEKTYDKNPAFLKLPYDFKGYKTFSKTAIQERCELYYEIAGDIWDISKLKLLVGGYEEDENYNDEIIGKNYVFEYNGRSWKDAIKFGFVSAGGKRLRKLRKGDRIFCHKAGRGFLGIGICEDSALSLGDFEIGHNKIKNFDLEDNSLINREDELIVKVKWVAQVNDENDGYWEKGLVSLPTTLYQLEDDYTYKKVLEFFNLQK